MQSHFYRITFVFSEASGKTMVFIIFRRCDHYPELCSRHGASLHFFSCERSERGRETRARWVKALHARFVFRSPEKRGKIGLLFQYFSLFFSLSFTLLKRDNIVCLQAALSRTAPRAMMALLESPTV